MAIAMTPTFTSVDSSGQVMTGTIAFSGTYGTASSNGEIFNVAALYYQGQGVQASPSILPLVEFFETTAAGTVPSGYNFLFCPGTTQQTCQLAVMNGLSQITPGAAYPAAILTTTVSFFLFIPTL